jgi:alpha-amylase
MRRTALPALLAALSFGSAGAALAQAPMGALPTTDWRRTGVCYEVFIRSFQDSDGDGVGDIPGLIQRLDYINDGDPRSMKDLGAQCIWLMPVAESPSYHGYDVADYYNVDREYGTNDDFKRLMAEAHKRGIRVLVDMVLNHASSEHPAFQAALRDPASPYRAWFRFSPTDGGRGPWGAPGWHRNPHRDEFYYGVFWQGMPDLNYDTPAVREEAKKIATHWLTEMGVDGFRLDAIPYLVEEGAALAGTPGTHALMREWGGHVRALNPAAYTVGEVWDSVGAMLPYYPDQLDSHFAFELSDAILAAVSTGKAGRLYPGYLRLQERLPGWRWSPFLRNHDQSRTMTVLRGDGARNRVAATLLLTLPGLPFLYYGEEIGMTGDKPDERIRTPMQWAARPGLGFTTGTPWQVSQPDSFTTTVEAQENDPGSLLNLHRRLVHLRAAHPALNGGTLVKLTAESDAVAAYLRRDGARSVLVVANLGQAPAENVRVASQAGALPRGRYAPRSLLDGPAAAPLAVGADGVVRGYVPFARLGPMEIHVLDLTPAR